MPTTKRGMRKIPLAIQAKLEKINEALHVASVRRILLSDIKVGQYTMAGLYWTGTMAGTSDPLAPPSGNGRFAKINAEGSEIVRRDLPKVSKQISFVNPCLFGEWGRICHITQTRQVFQREQIAAPQLTITSDILYSEMDSLIVRFSVNRAFSSQQSALRDRELLFALNLLNETVGSCSVFPLSTSVQDYLRTVHVPWEILPAGEKEKNISILVASLHPKDKQEAQALETLVRDRYDFFLSLGAKEIISGLGGMQGYMGAKISEDVVVFENTTPGNGIYIMRGDWKTQSQRTKTDLLLNGEEGVDYVRITHTGDWKYRVQLAISRF